MDNGSDDNEDKESEYPDFGFWVVPTHKVESNLDYTNQRTWGFTINKSNSENNRNGQTRGANE